jgi:Chaperone of endosialidase
MRTTATEKRFFARADEKLTAFLNWKWRFALVVNCLDKLPRFFRNFPDMKTSIPPVLITFALVCFALLPGARAVTPPPDGDYPGGNTAEGQNALLSLATGTYNTAVGLFSLESIATNNFNTAIGAGTLLANTADDSTATGAGALLSNTTGENNTASGVFALFDNTTGDSNTANGFAALGNNTTGSFNTANGVNALLDNTIGENNTAVGNGALFNNTVAFGNTATGFQALRNTTAGGSNTATGVNALFNNTTGGGNTAIGSAALFNNTTGDSNTAVGDSAGLGVTTAANVICIGANGANVNNSCFIGNIFNATSSGGTAVFIDSDGKLGTATSSQRFKEQIKPMEQASEALYALKPVTFRYQKGIDPQGIPQFGLVAEDVEAVNPHLVVRDKEGKPYTVRYEAVNAMLLNEFLKEHRKNEEQEKTIAELKSGMTALAAMVKEQAAQIQKVSARLAAASPSRGGLEASEAAPQVVNNHQ